jgi:two-component system, cell cycle sensor histidine kinase and response regulator CckA
MALIPVTVDRRECIPPRELTVALLVEDDEGHRVLALKHCERACGWLRVVAVSTLKEARDYLASHTPAIVITDYQLPDGEGIELLPADRDSARYPVILVTGYGSERLAVEAIKAGALDYVQKSQGALTDIPAIVERALREWDEIVRRRQAEEALRRSKDFLQTVIDALPDPTMVIGVDFHIALANKAVRQFTGGADPVERRLCCFQVSHHRAEPCIEAGHPCPIAQVLATHAPVTLTHIHPDSEGRERYFDVNAAPIFNEAGEVVQIIESCHEVTDRIRLQEQILQGQKLESLGVLAGGVAHDFNNLLVGILGNASLALMDLPAGSPLEKGLLEIQEASQRAADLCQKMLAYSGRGRFVTQPENLNTVLQEMFGLLTMSVSKKAIVDLDLAGKLPLIEADDAMIRQMIVSLAVNASEAIGEAGGEIRISTGTMECDRKYLEATYLNEQQPEGDYVYLDVSDTGAGMDDETLKRIFDPFFTTKFVGRGLGLPAVLGTVRAHKGAIKVSSKQGKGSTFRTLFPALP